MSCRIRCESCSFFFIVILPATSASHREAATGFAFGLRIAELSLPMAFDLKEIIASRLGENYKLHERHINRTLVAAQRVIGFDKVYARAEGVFVRHG